MAASTTTKKPRVILGLMTFGPPSPPGARITSLPEFTSILTHLHSRGYYELDTARVYVSGHQERFTSDALASTTFSPPFTIATKIYPSQTYFHTRESLRQVLAKSLEALRTDKVDIFYLHAADRRVPFEETLAAVDELHKEGKFNKLGLSNFTAWEVAEVCTLCRERGWVLPSIYQGMYNVITRAIEKELIPCCKRYGLDIVVYNPIAGGLFSGKIKSWQEIPSEGRFSDETEAGKRYRDRYFSPQQFAALKVLEEAGQESGLEVIEIALRWLVHHSKLNVTDGNDGIIVGVSSEEQLVKNLDLLEKGPLPEEVVKKVDEAWRKVGVDQPDYWHLDLKWKQPWNRAKVNL